MSFDKSFNKNLLINKNYYNNLNNEVKCPKESLKILMFENDERE